MEQMESGPEPRTSYPPTASQPGAAYPPTGSQPGAAYPPTGSQPGPAYPPTGTNYEPGTAYPPGSYPPNSYTPPPMMTYPPQQRSGTIVRGVLTVTVISAEELVSADIMGKADPYVVLKMKKSEAKGRTTVIYDSLEPVWNQAFDFLVENGLRDELTLELWDHDTFGRDFMGKSVMTMERAIAEGEYADSVELEGAKKGKLNIRVKWTPLFVCRRKVNEFI